MNSYAEAAPREADEGPELAIRQGINGPVGERVFMETALYAILFVCLFVVRGLLMPPDSNL